MTVWRAIPGYEGRYEVSDLGDIRSLPRQGTTGKLLTQAERSGYLSVTLFEGNRGQVALVHRLVLLAHVGPPAAGQEAAHNNGDSRDNRLVNLRWASRAENTEDRARHGKYRRAMDDRLALTAGEAEFVRANYKRIKQADLAQMFGVCRSTIQRIHSGERNAALTTTKIEKDA